MAQQGEVTLLFTNDLHAQFRPSGYEVENNDSVEIGGFIALQYAIENHRNDHTLLLDAGDSQTGSPISDLMYGGARGGGVVAMMNRIGYDAAALGNHELDYGVENALSLFRLARFDVLAANLYRNDSLFFGHAFRIETVGRVRVGIIGLTSDDLPNLVARSRFNHLRVDPVVGTAQELIRAIDGRTDLIVLLTHQGLHLDSLTAASVEGADVVVGGHSHTYLETPQRIHGILVVQTGSYGRNLGWLDLEVCGDSVADFRHLNVPVRMPKRLASLQPVSTLVDSFETRILTEHGATIGRLKSGWVRSNFEESAMGDFFSDVIRNKAGSDFAVLNSGALRKDLIAGPVRGLDLLEVFPFPNRIVTFSCSGREILTLCKTNVRSALLRKQPILQISGLAYEAIHKPDGSIRIVRCSINGRPVDPEGIYFGSTVDYVLDGNALRYLGFEPASYRILPVYLSDAVIEASKKNPRIRTERDGRILVKAEK